jgi:hypothetical protein
MAHHSLNRSVNSDHDPLYYQQEITHLHNVHLLFTVAGVESFSRQQVDVRSITSQYPQ